MLVLGTVGVQVGCTSGFPTVGLYLDNVPVPGSRHYLGESDVQSVTLFGVTTSPVAAGNHDVKVGSSCTDGGFTNAFISGLYESFGAVPLSD